MNDNKSKNQGFVLSNINDRILFKPRPAAMEAYRKYMNSVLGDKFPNLSRELEVDKDGYSEMQLWDFMKTFGDHFRIGSEPIVDMEVFIEYKTPLFFSDTQ